MEAAGAGASQSIRIVADIDGDHLQGAPRSNIRFVPAQTKPCLGFSAN
jgi:hypothetical protein